MREILFRGKTEDGEWLDGCGYGHGRLLTLMFADDDQNQEYPFMVSTMVIPETVGQYVPLTDEHNDKLTVYEGDIVEAWEQFIDDNPKKIIGKVEYDEGEFYVTTTASDYAPFTDLVRIRIIGNIHDNPELLEDQS